MVPTKLYSTVDDIFVLLAGLVLFFITNAIPDYFSLLETRVILRFMPRVGKSIRVVLLLSDLIVTVGTAVAWNIIWFFTAYQSSSERTDPPASLGDLFSLTLVLEFVGHFKWVVYPALFTSVWLWLYAGSGFLLKAARRFDLGFDWFNRKFDIEKRPLQSIGLVAGAIVAVVYWAVVIITRLV